VIPIEIEIKNFLAYRNPEPLNLSGVHVACLAGPNGAGKTSVLDAMTWALWGKARTNSADDLIHQGETEMRVVLTFQLGQQRFRVIRQRVSTRRGSSLLEFQGWMEETQSWAGLSGSTIRETQQLIIDLLRLDYDTFVNSSLLMQGRADEFTTKPPAQRKQVLSNILGLAEWEIYEKRAREKLAGIKNMIEHVDQWLHEFDQEINRRSEYEEEAGIAGKHAADMAQELAAQETAWAQLEAARLELLSVQANRQDLEQRIRSNQNELDQFERDLQVMQQRADSEAFQIEFSQAETRVNELKQVQQSLDEVVLHRERIREEIATLKGANQAMISETEPVKARIVTLSAAEEPVCPTCSQPLSAEHRQQLVSTLESDLNTRRGHYRKNRDSVAGLEQELEAHESHRIQLELQLRERANLEKRIGELQAALGFTAEAAQQAQNLAAQLARRQKEILADQARRTDLLQKADALQKDLKGVKPGRSNLDQLRHQKRMADERVGAAQQKLAVLEAVVRQREERMHERGNLADQQGIYELLRKAFGKQGVPAMIIETVVPELEKSANELLAQMTDGRMRVRIETQREIKTGELREALDIIISDELGSRAYELYSGGEAFRINFAIRIALSRLLARRAGAQLRSLFIDEGFGTQDARGREHLIEAINSIQDDFDLILVITHIDELKEAFPARIEVQKTDQGSIFSVF